MKKTLKSLLLSFAAILSGVTALAQVTTSSLTGRVTDEASEPVAGANIVAVHVPSGTQYYGVANAEGLYHINGMRAGGPYTVSVSFLGMATAEFNNVTVKLGDPFELDATLKASAELDAVIVASESSFTATKTGAGQAFNRSQVENMPTIDRSIYDIVKYTPQASVNKDGGISFAGTNVKYNSFQIDGAVANDAFGLSDQATVGGQTSTQPVSLDAIEEVQVVVAPFDVRQSGFTGGAINAITKSGSNEVKGTAYAYFYNQDFIATTAGPLNEGQVRKKYDTQNTQTYGVTVGAPIIKDKLFLFVSAEYYKKSYPNIYTPESPENFTKTFPGDINYKGRNLGKVFNADIAGAILEHYQDTYFTNGVPEGFSESFSPHQVDTWSINALARIDWNINKDHKFMFRYQLLDASKDSYSSGSATYYFNNSSNKKVNVTNTFVAELNSRFSDIVSNELRLTGVLVRDHREVPYQAPTMYIKDNIYVDLGTEYSSGANSMDNDTFTLTDNVSVFLGNHNLTAGVNLEYYSFKNLFIQNVNGEYEFKNLQDFFDDKPSKYYFNYADPTAPGVTGTRWAATTYAMQAGAYVQDEWKPNRDFTLTYGLRFDVPMLLNDPTANEAFNASAISVATGEKVGVTPAKQPLFSPRVGFRWWMDQDHKSLLRGGAGLFTGRVPFVWLSNAYNNTGIEMKSITISKNMDQVPFTNNPYHDIVESGVAAANGKATINTLNRTFRYPQVFRANLGFDQDFGEGWSMTLDALYTRTLNNVYFNNLALTPAAKTYAVDAASANAANVATYYDVNRDYNTIVALQNTNLGYTYSLSAQVNKHFNFGLDLMASYTFGHSYSVNDGASSVANSNWKNCLAVNTASPELGYSLYDRPHKVNFLASYTSPVYAGFMRTSVSLSYEGSSGARHSYVMKESADYNNDGNSGNFLLYVPTKDEITRMNWADPADAAQYEKLIRSDEYLSSHRGQFSERFAGITPFEHHFDLHLAQDFIYDKSHGRKVQVVVDFLNISNLFNREWGLYNNNPWNKQVLEITGMTQTEDGNYVPTYKYNYTEIRFADFASRWKCQLGLRLTF